MTIKIIAVSALGTLCYWLGTRAPRVVHVTQAPTVQIIVQPPADLDAFAPHDDQDDDRLPLKV